MAFVDVALAVGATVGLEGTAAVIGGGALMGAGAGGLYSAITGDGNILNSALLGAGIGGGAAYGLGALGAGAGAAGGIGEAAAAAAPTIAEAPVAGSLAANAPVTGDAIAGMNALNGWTGAVDATSAASGALPDVTAAEMASYNTPAYDPNQVIGEGGSSVLDWMKANKGLTALGGTAALGYLMNQGNKQYGIGNTTPYNGNSLASFKYDRTKYTPVTTPQPTPYQAQYTNYVKNPYNAYAAKGGQVRSYAEGGIAGAAPLANPSIGAVEQMSRDNAVGQNQMFPQANINSPAFSSATNTPMGQNMISSAADVAVDPYTGQEKFARGGLAATKCYADGGSVTPDQITANSVNYNNALMQQLQSAINTPAPQMNPGQVAQQAPLQPMPSGAALAQTPYQAPAAAAPAQSFQGYGAPSFTRTAVPNVSLDPRWITGMPAQQAKAAADAEAQRMRDLEYTSRIPNVSYDSSGGGKAGGLMPKALRYDIGGFVEDALTLPAVQLQAIADNPGQAMIGANTPFETNVWNNVTGAQMRPTTDMYGRPIDEFGQLKKFAAGGKIPNHMAAIDNYVAQYQTDPAKVMAKAKAGDWNAMLAVNKVNGTPNENYAAGGGVGHLGGYAAGGNPQLLKGPGDGMSDNIPASIGGKQPARLADGEFVVPADVVSHLGNGSTDAGAKHLYNMMDKVRKARTGSKKQGKQIKPEKFLKG